MLIEQIVALRRPGHPSRTCTPITGYFHDKTNISQENLQVDLLLKYCRRQCTLIYLYLSQIIYKILSKNARF